MQMKVIIDGQVYDGRTVDDVSIRQALAFDRECAEKDYPVRWADIERIRAEVLALDTDAERARHPEALLLTAVTIWATMLAAGEDATFESAIDRPLGSVEFIDVSGKGKGEKPDQEAATPDPHRARPGSGRASAGGKGKRKSGRSQKRT